MNIFPLKNKMIYCVFITIFFVLFSGLDANAGSGLTLSEKHDKNNSEINEEKMEYAYTEESYNEIYSDYPDYIFESNKSLRIELPVENYICPEDKSSVAIKNIEGKNAIYWDENTEWIEWNFNIQDEGAYEIWIEYYIISDVYVPATRSIIIDGEIPFYEAYNIDFTKIFTDSGEPVINSIGNEISPRQEEIKNWQFKPIEDKQGKYESPYLFYLKEGEHSLRLSYINYQMAISRILIKTPDKILSYAELAKKYKNNNYNMSKGTVKIQAEKTGSIKNKTTIFMDSDSYPATEPFSYDMKLMNIISNFDTGGDEISWKFNIEKEGLYKIGLRIQQPVQGLPVYRQILIDGKVPFKELLYYKFEYEEEWQYETLGNEAGPYLFYLEKGEHEITFKAVMGEMQDILNILTKNSLKLSDYILKMNIIVGNDIDLNKNFHFDVNIPGIFEDFALISSELRNTAGYLQLLSKSKLNYVESIYMCCDQIDKILNDTYETAKHIDTLTTGQNALADMITELEYTPLDIDFITIGSPDEKWVDKKASFWVKIYATLRNFIRSFTVDYTSISYIDENIDSTEVINVWCTMGRDWAEVVKDMAEARFTPEKNIKINMNVLTSGAIKSNAMVILLALSAGKAPDVALGVSGASPVEFAIRNAVVDLSKFDDFDSVKKRYFENILIPLEYNGGIYALPETMRFKIMYYRKDILERYNIQVPRTWEEVCVELLPQLYKYNMLFSLGSETAGEVGNYDIFLYQNGGKYYTDDKMMSTLNTKEAQKAFSQWLDLFINYGMPVEGASFYTKFRTGEMPVGISSINFYRRLLVAAPELKGKWGVACIPGIENEDGIINRTICDFLDSTCLIFSQSNKENEAWEFLKWWTSAETQKDYNSYIESKMGQEARVISANIEAFDALPWDLDHLKVFKEQLKWCNEIPVVLGGYMTKRQVTNAFTRSFVEGMPYRESLDIAYEEINKELIRKQEEYGFIE